jgi:cystathionine beta-lyase/cystathionine gamma-synthase
VFSSPEAAEQAFDVMAGRAKLAEGERNDLVYSRFNHPNAEILEDHLIPLEAGSAAACVFNSGMAAIMTAMLAYLKPGDAVLHTLPLYGGTQKLLSDFLATFGIRSEGVDAGDTEGLRRMIEGSADVRIVYAETPANPTLRMADLRSLIEAAGKHPRKPLVMVDNTFLGPAFQKPLEMGADVVLYSATKYLGGFSDLIGGVALSREAGVMGPIRSKRSLFGNILQPDECWILDSRLPTVHLRMNRQSKNAQRIAEALAGHAKIETLYYPTLFTDPEQKRIYEAQCTYPGGMIAIDLKGGKAAAFAFLRRIELARNAVSLGGVETLVCHPKSTTHSGFTEERWRAEGITDGLVRLSVGIEDWRDLLADIEQALEGI